ncbi:uncharacterized protein LOC144452941 [Glandiceps talaboti]
MDANQVIFVVMVTFLLLANCYARPSRHSDDWLCKRTIRMVHKTCNGCYATPDNVIDNNSISNEPPPLQEDVITANVKETCCRERCSLDKIIQFCCEDVQNEFRQFMSIVDNRK